MIVADLFCGMGGLSYGFAQNGYSVIGYDINKYSEEIYNLNNIGNVKTRDLFSGYIDEEPEIVIGGPPCKPWSSINLQKRGNNHKDYKLLDVFFKNVVKIQPNAFLMENVLPIRNDLIYNSWIGFLSINYSISNKIIQYSDYGAPTKRRRLFTAGFKNQNAKEFFSLLEEYKEPPKSVGDVIKKYEKLKKNEYPDHIWPNYTTIEKYKNKYESGKFGWYILEYNKPALSFGNITKTYTLHPLAWTDQYELRVISVREAMAIMGFNDNFVFPSDMGHTIKYQMVADVVSPIFSMKAGKAMHKFLDYK
ncbi:MAG: DNA cytosine methyltransferase [Candidatus Odinarchaeia archaeon]